MSADIHQLQPRQPKTHEPVLHPVTEATLQAVQAGVNDLRTETLSYEDVRAAFALYQYLKAIETDVAVLVDMAGAHVEQLMTRGMN